MSNLKSASTEAEKTTIEKIQDKARNNAQWLKDKAKNALKPDYLRASKKKSFAEEKRTVELEKLAPKEQKVTTE